MCTVQSSIACDYNAKVVHNILSTLLISGHVFIKCYIHPLYLEVLPNMLLLICLKAILALTNAFPFLLTSDIHSHSSY